MNTKKTKELVKNQQSKGEGSGVDYLKLEKQISYIAILPGLDGKDFSKKVVVHESWTNKKLNYRVACAKGQDRSDCPVCNMGWQVRDHYANSKDEKKKELFRKFMPTTTTFVNAVDMKASEIKPKVYRVPNAVYSAISDEIDDAKDLNDLFDIDDGKILKIKTNGLTGLKKKYDNVKFTDKHPKLIVDGKIDIDDLIDQMKDLETLDTPFSMKKLEKLALQLKKKYLKGIDLEDEEVVEEDEVDTDDEEFESDEDDDDEDNDVDEDDEDEDNDSDLDDDDDSDLDDDDDSDLDDDDDSDLDDDDDSDLTDDEDEEPPKKKKQKNRLKSKKKETTKKKKLKKKLRK